MASVRHNITTRTLEGIRIGGDGIGGIPAGAVIIIPSVLEPCRPVCAPWKLADAVRGTGASQARPRAFNCASLFARLRAPANVEMVYAIVALLLDCDNFDTRASGGERSLDHKP